MALALYNDPEAAANDVAGPWSAEQRKQESRLYEDRVAYGGTTTVAISNMSHQQLTESAAANTREGRVGAYVPDSEAHLEAQSYREKSRKSLFLAEEKQKYLARRQSDMGNSTDVSNMSERLLTSTKSSSRASYKERHKVRRSEKRALFRLLAPPFPPGHVFHL